MVGLHHVRTNGLNLLIHKRFNLVRPHVANDDEATIVADERGQFAVTDHTRELLKQGGLLRVVDVLLYLVARAASELAHKRVKSAEHIEILTALRSGILEALYQSLARVLDDFHGIGHDKRAEGSAADDDVLPGLPDDGHMSAHGDETAKHTAERN